MKLPPVPPDDPEVGQYIAGLGGEGIGETSLAMYLNKTSPHPAEALDFLRFLTSVPGNQLFTDHSLWLPAVNSVVVPKEIRNFRDYQQGLSFGQAPYDAIGSEVSMQWDKNFYLLIGDQGGVDQYAAALDRVMPEAIRHDLQGELRNTLLLVKPQDAFIVAAAQLVDDTPAGRRQLERQHEIEEGQNMSEGLALQMQLTLESTQGKP